MLQDRKFTGKVQLDAEEVPGVAPGGGEGRLWGLSSQALLVLCCGERVTPIGRRTADSDAPGMAAEHKRGTRT